MILSNQRITKAPIRLRRCACKCGSRGGTGGPDPPPPGKSLVLWVSIGNKQLDPLPLEKIGPPPPPPEKCWTPSGILKNDKLRTKKKIVVKAFFLSYRPGPPPPLTKIPRSAHGRLVCAFQVLFANPRRQVFWRRCPI